MAGNYRMPNRSAEARRSVERVSFWCSPREKERLKNLSDKARLSMSDFLRKLIAGKKRFVVPDEKGFEVLSAIYKELNRQGVNYWKIVAGPITVMERDARLTKEEKLAFTQAEHERQRVLERVEAMLEEYQKSGRARRGFDDLAEVF